MEKVNVVPMAILVAYIILTLVIANMVLRKRLGSEHYLVAGRSLPFIMVMAVVLGDWLGGGSTVGVCQRGYNEGIVGWFYPISIGIGLLIFSFTLAGAYRKLRAITIAEVAGRVFGTRTRITSAVVIGVAYFAVAITQVVAGGALLAPLLGIDKWLADLIAALIFIAIITAGGLASVAAVNIVQCVVIYVGMILGVFFALAAVGDGSVFAGVNVLSDKLPASFWSFDSIAPVQVSGEVLATILSCFVAQAALTGVFAARDEKAAVSGTRLAGILIIPIGITFVLLGMCARIYYGTTLPFGLSAGPAMILALHPVVAGVALCGLFAAIISTGPLCFLAPTQILIRDVYTAYINPEASDKKVLLYSRILGVVLVILGWILAVAVTDILDTLFWAFALRSAIAVILIMIAYLGSRRISEDGAFWGLIIGVGVLIIWTLLGSPYHIQEAVPLVVVIAISTLIISRFRKRKTELSPEVSEALYGSKKE
jgi:solute:Na+ symporter, SSS family